MNAATDNDWGGRLALAALPVPHLVVDGFLDDDFAARVFESMVAAAPAGQGRVGSAHGDEVDPKRRQSTTLVLETGLRRAFLEQVLRHREDFAAMLGLPPFVLHGCELEAVTYKPGGFYVPHVDVRLGADALVNGVRRLTCVYYAGTGSAKAFRGGDIRLFRLPGDDKTQPAYLDVETLPNRLVSFPSHMLHEVLPVLDESLEPHRQRYSINVWMSENRA